MLFLSRQLKNTNAMKFYRQVRQSMFWFADKYLINQYKVDNDVMSQN